MKIKNTVVNSNQNSRFQGNTYYSVDHLGESNLGKLKYQPIAHMLIQTFWKSPYKTQPNSYFYNSVERMLVSEMEFANRNSSSESAHVLKEHAVWMIANALEINPILLHNFDGLPDYLKMSNSIHKS